MLVYIVLLIFTIFSLLLYTVFGKKIFSMIPYIAMAVVSGVRYEVGVDYENYIYMYKRIEQGLTTWNTNEVGYLWIVRLVQRIGGTQQLIFLIFAIMTSIFYYKFIYKMSDSFCLSTMLYMCLGPFYFSSYNTVREALAVSIVLYALTYLEKDRIKYCMWVFIAALFHKTALLFLGLLLIKKIGTNYLKYYVIGTVGFWLIVQSNILTRVILIVARSYYKYIYRAAGMDMSYAVFLLMYVIIYMAYIRMDRKNIIFDKEYMILLTIACILITVGLTTGKYTMLLTRLISYGSPAILVLLPKARVLVKQKTIYNLSIYGACIGYFFFIINTARDMLPYGYDFKFF